LARLGAWTWPGNVRELEHALESAMALSQDGTLDLSLLPGAAAPAPAVVAPRAGLKERVDAYERGLILSALESAKGNRSEAARMFAVSRSTLHDKLQKHGLAVE